MKIPSFVLLAIIFALSLVTARAQNSLTNMVAYYPFNGDANDQSGNNRNGTVNGATPTMDRLGNTNSAYTFDDDSIVYPGIPLNLNGSYSFSTWFKLYVYEPGMEIFEISAGSTCNWNPVLFQVDSGVSINHCGGGQPNIFFGSAASLTNLWCHFAMTVTNGVTKIYNNGVLASSKTNAPWPTTTFVTLTLGASRNGIGQFSNCAFDDVRIYNRALSASEVEQLHAMPVLQLNVRKAVYLDTDSLLIGMDYQVQFSTDMNQWINHGSVFTATNSFWRSTNYWDAGDWNNLFFRLRVVP